MRPRAARHPIPPAAAALPRERGSYLLLLRLAAPARLTIGRLGAFDLAPGSYAYAGSALGAGGLRGRLMHHLRPVRRPHWHIDYLRAAAPLVELWWRADATPLEHRWAETLRALPDATLPVPAFGASDCRCAAHLLHFPVAPMLATFCAYAAQPLERLCL